MSPNPLMNPASHTLIIRHVDQQRFVVTRQETGKSSDPVELIAPDTITVEGRPNSNLLGDLRWYLEEFLELPIEPYTDVAERIQRALSDWGRSTFERLFQRQALVWYDGIRNIGLEHLVLKVASDDPRVLAWPWEALCDPESTTLAHVCRLERQLNQVRDAISLPAGLSRTQVNILLVIARPYGDGDVGFHAVSGPLVEWIHQERVAVQIDVLRPPTFDALQRRLEAQPAHYHIVHFDGHGGYGATGSGVSQYHFHAMQGHLVFEDAQGKDDPVEAQKLTALLTEHRIPIMVLNACQSARVDAQAEDPFASTAAALLKAGIRSVVAMGYNLYVSGAQQFVPSFYRRLLQTGDVAEATRAGRKAMLQQDRRIGPLCEYPLQDWLVPILYQQDTVPLGVESSAAFDARLAELPEEARDLKDYGFIGRQDAIQQLERALLQQPAAAVLIHGMAGIGKTMLVKGVLRWMQQTNGIERADSDAAGSALFKGTLWFSFEDIHSAEYVINRLIRACVGNDAAALSLGQKLSLIVRILRERPLLLVWDNFESAAGREGTEVAPLLVAADRALLQTLLGELRGGRTKVLITSRSPESWLSPIEAFALPLRGLWGEDLWVYCNAVVRDLGLTLSRTDKDCVELLKELDGHPLALRAVLLQLKDLSPREALNRLRRQFSIDTGDKSTQKIFAALAMLNERLPAHFSPTLQYIGLHQRYVDIDYLEQMMGIAGDSVERQMLDHCFVTLERSGLIHGVGQGIYGMHPALHAFLAKSHPAEQARISSFVEFMAGFASHLAPKELYNQRRPLAIHGANFQHALALATSSNATDPSFWLTQSLAVFAQNTRDFSSATRLFQTLAESQAVIHPERAAGAYHHLGIIAQEQRDFRTAEHCFLKSLAIEETVGNERGAASTYHHLGINAQEQHDFETAERWYLKSLAIQQKHGNEPAMAGAYHQLGIIAQWKRDFQAAERWYLKSLEIKERHHNEPGLATTYHQLGNVAHAQDDLQTAKDWYLKSVAIEEKHGDEHSASITYHQLGRIAEEQRDYQTAERWYLKSLSIQEKHGNQHDAAGTYHQLGCIAEEQRNFEIAQRWYLKSLAITEHNGDENGAAGTYHHLGIIAQEQHDFETAERWYLKSLEIEQRHDNAHGVAISQAQLGKLALLRKDLRAAGELFLGAIAAFIKTQNARYCSLAVRYFISCFRSADALLQQHLRECWKAAGLDQHYDLEDLIKLSK